MHGRQLEKLLLLADLAEVLNNELIGLLVEIRAAVLLREVRDADGVRRVELFLEESTARVYDVRHLILHRRYNYKFVKSSDNWTLRNVVKGRLSKYLEHRRGR